MLAASDLYQPACKPWGGYPPTSWAIEVAAYIHDTVRDTDMVDIYFPNLPPRPTDSTSYLNQILNVDQCEKDAKKVKSELVKYQSQQTLTTPNCATGTVQQIRHKVHIHLQQQHISSAARVAGPPASESPIQTTEECKIEHEVPSTPVDISKARASYRRINTIPVGTDTTCGVCLEELIPGQDIVKILKKQRGHVFHKACLDESFKTTDTRCPHCQTYIYYDESQGPSSTGSLVVDVSPRDDCDGHENVGSIA